MSEIIYRRDPIKNIARLIINTAGPVNTIGDQFIRDFADATEMAKKDNVRGVILASNKKTSFLDGANLMEIMKDASALNLKYTLLKLHEALASLAKAPFPVVAVLSGQTALGGGFETLLWACDHIVASPGTKMGLPEVSIGLFPAAGGPETLRKVIGLEKTIEIIMRGQVLPAEAYQDSGIVTIARGEDIQTIAEQWIESHLDIDNRNYDPQCKEPSKPSKKARQSLIEKARNRYAVCPEKPYFRAALDAIEEGFELSFEEAVRNEVNHFAPLIEHPNVKNKIDFFFLMTSIAPKLSTVNVQKAIPVPELAIIGAGLMGQGIAQVCADKGIKVLLIDIDMKTAETAKEMIGKGLDPLIKKGSWTPERKKKVMDNIRLSDDYNDLKTVPIVIEAVFEDLDLKRKILKQVQKIHPDIVFASNTSTIPMQKIADESLRPEMVVGMHYFSPVPLMPLLEVIQGPQTSESALATAAVCGKQQGKTCVIVGDGPGFYTSRTFGVYVMTGFYLAEMGVDPWEIDQLALEAGFPQGPLNVYGTAGGNVIYHAGLYMQSNKPGLITVPQTLIKMYEAGYVGAGKPCFYGPGMKPDQSVMKFIIRNEAMPTPTREEVKEMLLLAMVNQAFWCLDEGVVKNYYSMDLASVLGIGFPDCWHGPGRYVSQKGVNYILRRLQEIHEKYGLEFFKPAREFERLIACGVDKNLV